MKTKQLSPRTRHKLEPRATIIDEALGRFRRAAITEVLLIGKELRAAQGQLGHRGNGTFGLWCTQRLGLSRSTVENMMRAFDVFGDCTNYVQTFDLSALYVLSKNGVPRAAIERAIALGKDGRHVKHQWAKEFVVAIRQEGCDIPDAVEAPRPAAPSACYQRPPPLELLKAAWAQATPDQRKEFRQWTKQVEVTTRLCPKTGRRLLVETPRDRPAGDG